jgi:hypothetical protein
MSGLVVTKPGKELQVNFARNQVLRSCARFGRILKLLNVESKKRIAKRTKLDDSERAQVFTRLRAMNDERAYDHHQFPPELSNALLFTDTTGRAWSYNQLRRAAKNGLFERTGSGWDDGVRYAFAAEGDLVADKVMQTRRGFVFSEECAEALAAGEDGFNHYPWFARLKMVYVVLDDLAADLNDPLVILSPDTYTPKEKAVLDALTDANRLLYARTNELRRGGESSPRILKLGAAPAALGWTDGRNYIALERGFLNGAGTELEGFFDICRVLLHEYCHDDPSSADHLHTPEFFRLFHDASDQIQRAATCAHYRYMRSLVGGSRSLEKKRLKAQAQAAHERIAFGDAGRTGQSLPAAELSAEPAR